MYEDSDPSQVGKRFAESKDLDKQMTKNLINLLSEQLRQAIQNKEGDSSSSDDSNKGI